jgi:hypothetical protein
MPRFQGFYLKLEGSSFMTKHFLILCSAALLLPATAAAQRKGKNTAPTAPVAPEKPKTEKTTIASKTKNCARMDGLFTLFRDTANGKLYMLVRKEQLNHEFIHFTYTENGALASGHHRGQYRGSQIIRIRKYYENIEFEAQNTGFYFNPSNPLSRSAQANISHALLATEKIAASDEAKGEYLIDADELFLSEKLHQVKPSPRPGMPPGMFSLGSLAKGKTKYEQVRNYPENTDLVVQYIYENPYPSGDGGTEVTDSRAVAVLLQHSLIALPENDFGPRFDDPRVGYFTETVNDMTSEDAVNYRDPIHRWNLVKKDPSQALSEPVKPIVWWIENTTPLEYRETIRQAALQWNLAFERIGFKNAVQVNIQPDTATWDAGDIRYNVLRWTSSPNPPFGGYGPSFVNPRTGEILGADIMLEYVFVTNRLTREKLFGIPTGLDQHDEHSACYASDMLHMQTLLGKQALAMSAGNNEAALSKLVTQSLYYLILHEMGHTMGLMHNMKASQLLSPEALKAKAGSNADLIGSVMDYPAINLNSIGGSGLDYCQTRPGPYDLWAIEYGYSSALNDEASEQKRLEQILARSSEPALTFGNDADDMRNPGKAIDPRVMVNDLSSDAITYAVERTKQVQTLLDGLKTRYSSGNSYEELRDAFAVISGEYSTSMGIISRYVGGVYVERSGPGSGKQPYTPVAYADQKRAMAALKDYAFAPDAMKVDASLIPFLQPQRRGFNFFAAPEDPKMHSRIRQMQSGVLNHLLHPDVMQRLSDSRLYGNTYSVSEMVNDLVQASFAADWAPASKTNTFRQNLQVNLTERLIRICGLKDKSEYDYPSKAAALAALTEINTRMKAAGGDAETNAHRLYLRTLIDQALEN